MALVASALLSACATSTAAHRAPGSGTASTSAAAGRQPGRPGAPAAASEHQPHSAGLSAPAIRAVVATHAKALEACYEHALHDRPKLKGVLVVRVPVNPDGSVSSPTVDASSELPASDALARCVLDLVAAWRFPKPAADDDVELVLPFAFKPKAPSKSRTPPASGGR